jgi:hypothetical protein
MRYKITAPVPGFTGKVAGIDFAKGVATIDTAVDGERRALEYFRRKAYVVEEVATEEAAAAPAENLAGKERSVPNSEQPEKPKRSASTEVWRVYAVDPNGGGMSAEEAEALSRDELAEKFLGPKEG